MLSIGYNELFEKYYQNEYDFISVSLSVDKIVIKKTDRGKEWMVH